MVLTVLKIEENIMKQRFVRTTSYLSFIKIGDLHLGVFSCQLQQNLLIPLIDRDARASTWIIIIFVYK
jgi:hypothetical protein